MFSWSFTAWRVAKCNIEFGPKNFADFLQQGIRTAWGRNQALRITAKFLRQTELFHEIPGSFAIAFGMPASLYGAKPHLYAVSAIFIIFAAISFIHGFFGATVQLRPFFKILLSAQKRNRFPGNNRGIASVVVDYEIICSAEIENRKCTCWGAFSRIDNFFGKVKGGRRRCCKIFRKKTTCIIRKTAAHRKSCRINALRVNASLFGHA